MKNKCLIFAALMSITLAFATTAFGAKCSSHYHNTSPLYQLNYLKKYNEWKAGYK